MRGPGRSSSLSRLLIALLALVLIAACGPRGGRTVKIGAAADLGKAFEELGRLYQSRTGVRPVFIFGSSGLLAKQLAEGAPYAVFAAANQTYVDELVGKGVCAGASKRLYARGRLVVWSKTVELEKLTDLTGPAISKIAIANPEHAPYGVAAQQALRAGYVWPGVEKKMVYAENVRQALQWAEDGQVDAALVAMSLAVVTQGGHALAVDPNLHAPLDQAAAVCGSGQAAADGALFVELLTSPEGREIMERYGFVMPTA